MLQVFISSPRAISPSRICKQKNRKGIRKSPKPEQHANRNVSGGSWTKAKCAGPNAKSLIFWGPPDAFRQRSAYGTLPAPEQIFRGTYGIFTRLGWRSVLGDERYAGNGFARMAGAPANLSFMRFSTDELPERERLPAFQEVFGRAIAKADVEPVAGTQLCIEATVRAMPGLGVWIGAFSPIHGRRTRETHRRRQ